MSDNVIDLTKAFLKKNRLGVLSTVSSTNHAESALIGYAECSDLSIIFGTDKISRKYNNLINKPDVSLVVSDNYITIQYEGIAKSINKNTNEVDLHSNKHTSFEKYKHIDSNIYFKIKPRWLRYSDYSFKPPLVLECEFVHKINV